MELEEFSSLFQLVLSQYDVGTIPVSLDRVTAGETTRQTGHRVKVLFLLGADDSSIPQVGAEPGLLSDDACREFSSVYVRRIVEQVQDDNFAVILHNCGNTGQCTAAMVATGSMGYHFGNGMDMAAALRDCPSDTLVMGNVDPVSVFKMGTPEQVYGASTALLEMAAGHPNFILSSGCDTPPGVPAANIEAFYRAVADFNGRKR